MDSTKPQWLPNETTDSVKGPKWARTTRRMTTRIQYISILDHNISHYYTMKELRVATISLNGHTPATTTISMHASSATEQHTQNASDNNKEQFEMLIPMTKTNNTSVRAWSSELVSYKW